MAGQSLNDILQQFSLEKYQETFASVGIRNTGHLLALTMQDYPTLGITSMQDRRKMFHLIQNIKDKENVTNCRALKYRGHQFQTREQKQTLTSDEMHDKEQCQTLQTPVQPKMTPKTPTTTTPNMHKFSYGIPSSKLKLSASKSMIDNESSNIKVCVRKRPLGSDEEELDEADIVDVEVNSSEVVINAPKVAVDLTKYMQKFSFVFDEVFDESFSNHQVYEKTAKPLVNAIFSEGAKATCFAYGCTGSGKTYTMLGTDSTPGLYLLAASDIFSILYSGNHGNDLGLWVSFYEIYCGQLFDLLNDRTKLFARENAAHQVCIVGLTERQVKNVEELMEVIESGGISRSTGSTGVNADSSRSHAILQLDLKYQLESKSLGRFSFIDLAGSERAADVTDSDKQTRMEGAEINQSLLALKECIRSLDQDSRHTPFRQSKLTQVLKDSFVGNTRTCMIANVSPCQSSCENTLNTLRYADRVKELNKSVTDPLSPRPTTVHGNNGSPSYITRITHTGSSMKDKGLGKSLNISSKDRKDIQKGNNVSTPKAKSKTVLKSLQIPPNTPGQSLLLSRPETSPAVLKEAPCKPRSRSRLHQLTKEQSYNMSQTNRQLCLQEKLNKEDKSSQENQLLAEPKDKTECKSRGHMVISENSSEQAKIVRPKSKFSVSQTRNCQPNQSNVSNERKEKIQTQHATYSYRNRGKYTQRNKLEVLPKESRIENAKESLTSDNKRKTNSQENLAQNVRTKNKKRISNNNRFHPKEHVIEEDRSKTPKQRPASNITSKCPLPNDQNTSTRDSQVSMSEKIDKLQNNQNFDILKLDTPSDSLQVEENFPGGQLDALLVQKNVHKEQKEPNHQSNFKTSPNATQSNHRYSKGIKARLAQLFNNKTATNSGVSHNPDNLALSSSIRVMTEEQLVAAHHTQLAMVTSLCHEEMVLLKQRENQDFQDYIAQVEEILLQKQTCIHNLQEKLRNWKATLNQ